MPVFFFTDIEGSTRLWEIHRQKMVAVLHRHDLILTETLRHYGGRIIDHRGDGVYAVFEGGDPLGAAIDLQCQFELEDWGPVEDVKIRIGLHGCPPEQAGQDYFTSNDDFYGPLVNHAARIMDTAWGGQIVLAPDVLDITSLPAGAAIQDLGRHILKSLDEPQAIVGLVHPDLPRTSFPPLRSLSLYRHNLPRQSATFVGREAELHTAVNFISQDEGRLLTLVGPGGIGKTRLAIQAAAETIDSFPQGVFFVPLTAVSAPDLIVPAIAEALEFTFYTGTPLKLQLLNFLREKRLLLILDNFEHLLAGAELVDELLWRAPQIKVLATCRQRLGVAAEHILRLGGLSIPPLDEGEALPSRHDLEAYSAVRLFVQAARRAQPDFVLNDDDRPAVIRLCQLLAGMPLGLELAASWVRMLSCAEIAARIEDNLDFLTVPAEESGDRQRSLRAVCDYFWTFLGETEQSTIRQLSLFRGGFAPDAGEGVAGASFFFLSALVDKTFLQATNPAGRPDLRYEMHEVLRHYAAEKLGERPSEEATARDAHAAYFATTLARLGDQLPGEQQQRALRQLSEDRENALAAWEWALQRGHTGYLDAMVTALFYYYRLQMRAEEGVTLFDRANDRWREQLPALDDKAPGNGSGEAPLAGWQLAVKLQNRRAYFEQLRANYGEAAALLDESVALARRLGAVSEEAYALSVRGIVDGRLGAYPAARRRLEASVALYRQLEDKPGTARSLLALANILYRQGEYGAAEGAGREALTLYELQKDRRGLGVAYNFMGVFAGKRGAPNEAQRYLQQSLALHEELDDLQGVSAASTNLGTLAAERGQYAAARAYHRRSLQIARTLGNPWEMIAALDNLGTVALATINLAEARRRFAEALALAEQAGSTPLILDILVGVAEILTGEGALPMGVKLLLFVERHPHLDQAETAGRAVAALAGLLRNLSDESRRQWVADVATWSLEDVLQHARAALTPAAIPLAY